MRETMNLDNLNELMNTIYKVRA